MTKEEIKALGEAQHNHCRSRLLEHGLKPGNCHRILEACNSFIFTALEAISTQDNAKYDKALKGIEATLIKATGWKIHKEPLMYNGELYTYKHECINHHALVDQDGQTVFFSHLQMDAILSTFYI